MTGLNHFPGSSFLIRNMCGQRGPCLRTNEPLGKAPVSAGKTAGSKAVTPEEEGRGGGVKDGRVRAD